MNAKTIELQKKIERINYWEKYGQMLKETDFDYDEESDLNFPVTYEDFQR